MNRKLHSHFERYVLMLRKVSRAVILYIEVVEEFEPSVVVQFWP
jgi:hypothetical protein